MGFIIYSKQRTGSTLLHSFLNSHPDLVCEGELFSRRNRKNAAMNPYEKVKRLTGASVGFMLKYNHSFVDFSEFKVIHLLRNDTMAQALSDIINKNKGLYGVPAESIEEISNKYTGVFLRTKVEKRMKLYRQDVLKASQRLQEVEHMTIYYEDITKGVYTNTCPFGVRNKLLHFLGASLCPLTTSLQKVNQLPEKIATNFGELSSIKNRYLVRGKE